MQSIFCVYSILMLFLICLFLLDYASSAPITIPWQNLDGYMTSEIHVGTPDQNLRVEFNFSSTNAYVIDSRCRTNGCLRARRGFNPLSSSTFLVNTNQFEDFYHGSRQFGVKAADVFGQLNVNRRQILPIGILIRTRGRLVRSRIEAVMGMSLYNYPGSFTEQFLNLAGGQMLNVFMSTFTYSQANGIRSIGELTFGTVDARNCEVNYYFQHSDSFDTWMVRIGQVWLGYDNVRGGRAIIRPNDNYIYGPRPAVDIIHQRLKAQKKNQGEYVVDCLAMRSFPELKIIIHAHEHVLFPQEYIVVSNDGCVLLIRHLSQNYVRSEWVLGAPLLRGNCILFDFYKKRIGFSRPTQQIG